MSSRSASVSVLGPRMRISANSLMGGAPSGRRSIGPRGPGTPSGSLMCGMEDSPDLTLLDTHRFGMGRRLLHWRVDIAFMRHVRAHGNISFLLLRSPGGETINVAVVHTESRGDQDRVVNLGVRCAFLART